MKVNSETDQAFVAGKKNPLMHVVENNADEGGEGQPKQSISLKMLKGQLQNWLIILCGVQNFQQHLHT